MISKINLTRHNPVNFTSKVKDRGSETSKGCKDCEIKEFKDETMPFIYAQMYFDNAKNLGIDEDTAFECAARAYLCYNGNV